MENIINNNELNNIIKDENELNDEKTNYIIKNNKLILNTSISIDKISKYLEYFNGYVNFKNDNIQSDEILYMLFKIKNKDNLENMIKFFDYYLVKEEYIIDYLNIKNPFDILKEYNKFKDYLHVVKILESVLIKYLENLTLLKMLELTLNYNLKFYIPILNKKLNKIDKDISIYYKNELEKRILNVNLNKDDIILDIELYNNFQIISLLYFNIKWVIHNEEYKDVLNILLENKIIASIYIFKNIENENRLNKIFNIYKNNADLLLEVYEKSVKEYIELNNYNYNNIYSDDLEYYEEDDDEDMRNYDLLYINALLDLIKNDIFKIEILNMYINKDYYFNINFSDFINYIMNDNKVSDEIIKKIILIKTQYNNLLFDSYININLINRQTIKSFVIDEYEKENLILIKNENIIKEFLKFYNIDINQINFIYNFNFYTFADINMIYFEDDDEIKFKYISLILSNKLILNNLNIEKFLNYLLPNGLTIIRFLGNILHNILNKFKSDINNANLKYILTTKKTRDNINLFDKDIIFISDKVSIDNYSLILDEKYLIYLLDHFIENYFDISKDNDFEKKFSKHIFDLSLYAIRYQYCELLKNIFKYKNRIKLNMKVKDKNNVSFLIDFAYTKKLIEIFYDNFENPYN